MSHKQKLMQSTDPYMRRVCWPRTSGRCPLSVAGEDLADEHFDRLLFGYCLERRGSDLAERRWRRAVVYFTPCSTIAACCNHRKECYWSTLCTTVPQHTVTVSMLFLGFTSLCAQSVVCRWSGVMLLRLLTRQLPVQCVHFSVLRVAPAAHPCLQITLRT